MRTARDPNPFPRRAGGRSAAALALVAILAAGTAACSGDGDSGASSTPSTIACPDSATCPPAGSGEAGLRLPATDSHGNFRAVDKPPSTGELAKAKVRLTRVAALDAPTALVSRPAHPNQLFVSERDGRILVANRSTDGSGALTFAAEPLLDWRAQVSTEGEEGMLGLAFDPTGKTLYFTTNDKDGDTRLSAVVVTDTPSWPTLAKPTTVLTVDQPDTTNHKGGDLAFGPDGFLYLGLGDGGGQGDPDQRAQNPNDLLGKLLRIDPVHPSDGKAYGIPPGNPYAAGGGAPEVWLTGLRNPWRFSFDPDSGDLFIGDVGQNEREEIDRLPKGLAAGANMGWSGYEGTQVFEKDRVPKRSVPPIYEELHRDRHCAITGGVVYRGKRLDGLSGAYLLADLCRSGIRVLQVSHEPDAPGKVVDHAELAGADGATQVIAFGTDADDEVYALSLGGQIWRLDPA